MARTLNDTHKSAIALRKAQAHMYAAGYNDALTHPELRRLFEGTGADYPYAKVDELEFSRYVEALARDYYSEVTYTMPSIPHALESFRTYAGTPTT